MSSTPETVPVRGIALAPGRRHRLAAALEENGTIVLLLSAFAMVLAMHIPQGLAGDGWLALVSGREIAQHGLPTHDALTVWAHGRAWVDQQWLAQISLYGLVQLGGLRLVMLVNALLGVGALVGACVLARRLGASARAITWVCLPALVAYYPEAVVMRPQSFAYPLFVAVLALVVLDSRRPSRRVFLALPLLMLWANLHGSVVVGALLVSLYGAAAILRALWERRAPGARWLALAVLPWGCVLVSPYAASLPRYYEKVLFTAHFSRYVTEWRPATLGIATLPLYLLFGLAAFLVGRVRGRVGLFETTFFLAVVVLSLQAVRNLAWLGLASVVFLPQLVDGIRPAETDEPRKLNRMLAIVALAGTFVTVLGVSVENRAWFLVGFPRASANAAAAAAGSNGRVFANERYGDWLLWEHPELAGRIAWDTRFELLTDSEIQSIAGFRERVGDWRATAKGYRVLVLNGGRDEKKVVRALLRSGGIREVSDTDGISVLARRG
jgi:hypothetical protein